MPFAPDRLTSRPVLDCSAAEQAEAMNRSFENYIVPLRFDVAGFQRRFRGENLDAEASRLWYCDGALVGVVYIARRGWTSRVAAMGLVPEARNQGLGRPMLQTAIDEARQRGDRLLMLEVFTNNPAAIRLYERLGLRITRTLSGFQRPAGAPKPTRPEPLLPTDPLTVARALARHGDADLPWMLAPETLAATTAPHAEAWQLPDGRAYALVRPDAEKVQLLTLVVPESQRRRGWGRRLLQGLAAHYAGRPLLMPCLLPPGEGQAFLQGCGWEPTPLALYEMELGL